MDDPLNLHSGSLPGLVNESLVESDEIDESIELMWPLDISLAVLGALGIYTIATRMPLGDPRWYMNPWLYAALVPLAVVASSLLLRNIASRFVRRSLQFGFLLSVLVHLLLLIAAFNMMIFSQIMSNATSGEIPVRSPIRKTVPDYLFSRTDLPQKQPDWSRPIDAVTTSRTITAPERQTPPLEAADKRLEMPSEQPQQPEVEPLFLTPRALPERSVPTPSASASKLARQDLRQAPSVESSVPVPEQAVVNESAPRDSREQTVAVERIEATKRDASQQLREMAATTEMAETPLTPPATQIQPPQLASAATSPMPRLAPRTEIVQPRLGSVSMERSTRSPRRPLAEAVPAGATPTTPTIAIARQSDDAARMLSDRSTELSESQPSMGAELRPMISSDVGSIVPDASTWLDAPVDRRPVSAAGTPSLAQVEAAGNPRQGDASRWLDLPTGSLAGPDLTDPRFTRQSNATGSTSADSNSDRLADNDRLSGADRERAKDSMNGLGPTSLGNPSPAAAIDLSVAPGPAGMSADLAKRIGFAFAESQPEVASLDFGQRSERKRDIGGPPPPAGTEILRKSF